MKAQAPTTSIRPALCALLHNPTLLRSIGSPEVPPFELSPHPVLFARRETSPFALRSGTDVDAVGATARTSAEGTGCEDGTEGGGGALTREVLTELPFAEGCAPFRGGEGAKTT